MDINQISLHKLKKLFPILLILMIAFGMRFWQINLVPPSLYWDEVSQGYNAYSILKTGRDEHQELLPLARFQAFGDYKAPVYIYLDVPFLALFGKNDLSVRLPSLILGTLTVFVTYLLTKELFYRHKKRDWIAYLAAFLLAISPWHVQLSRVAYEANIATFFTVSAVALFLLALRKNPLLLPLSVTSFVLAFYSFNAHRVFIPLFVLSLCIIFRKELFALKKYVVSSGIIGIIMLLPFLFYFVTPESKLRFQEVNIFSDVTLIKQSNQLMASDENSIIGRLIHNRRVLYGISYISHYFDFFNPSYLFFSGDQNPRFSDQEDGELYFFLLPGILVGFYLLLSNRTKTTWLLLVWFLLAPVAGATARETPHALRSETFIPTYEIIASFGFISLFLLIPRKLNILRYGVIGLFFILALLSCIRFLHNYLIDSPREYSKDWQYGYNQAVEKTKMMAKNYSSIYFTNTYGRAYIYVAWYGDFTPQDFWKNVSMKRDAFGFYNVDRLGKYIFTTPPVQKNPQDLFVTTQDAVPPGNKVIDRVLFLDGTTAFAFSVPK